MQAARWPVSPSPRLAGARALQDLAPLGAPAELTLHQLHRRYFDYTWSTLRHLGVPVHSMDDAAQDVWLTVHRQLDRFEGRSTARTWLFGIVLNTVRNLRRSLRRHPPPAPLSEDLLPFGTCPDTAHDCNEALALVQRFLDDLDAPSRHLFTLYFLEGVTAAEAAERLSIEVSFLYERARRLRRTFKRWFAAQHAEQA
jgi:RNA polymerase sigma-70 factor (ECF subfamily)